MHRWYTIAALVSMLAAVSAHAQSKKGLTVDDMLAMQRVSEPEVSPDGRLVAFTVRDTDRSMTFAEVTGKLGPGVTAKDVVFFSEGVKSHGRLFLPSAFSATSNAAAVVVAPTTPGAFGAVLICIVGSPIAICLGFCTSESGKVP